jgi:hypothetical protein
MAWSDLAASFTVSGLMGEIFYFIAASDAVRGNRQRRARFPPTQRNIEALARFWRRLWIHLRNWRRHPALHNRRDGRIIA